MKKSSTISLLKALIREASTIPRWVQVGSELDNIAGEFEDLARQQREIQAKREDLINKIAEMKKGAEYGLDLNLEDLLRRLTMNISFENAVMLIRKCAQGLKTAKR